jgi:hypothetical protein
VAHVSGCERCGRKRGTWRVSRWHPEVIRLDFDWWLSWGWQRKDGGLGVWGKDPLLTDDHVTPAFCRTVTRCIDAKGCAAYVRARQDKAARRCARFDLELPRAPDAPMGECRWCGATLTGENAERRNYCYEDREGRDCRRNFDRSTTWKARDAVRHREFIAHGLLACVDCGQVCEEPDPERYARGSLFIHGEHRVLVRWHADHELALEDGGLHVLDNLRCRCVPCHQAKTAEENRMRAAA